MTMKKSEKQKGKEKVAVPKEQYKMVGIAAAILVLVIAVIVIYFVFVVPPVVVAAGDTVNVTYTLMFDNKTVYQTNVNTSPFTFTVGMRPGASRFDVAGRGMKVNEEKTVMVLADQGYVYNPDSGPPDQRVCSRKIRLFIRVKKPISKATQEV